MNNWRDDYVNSKRVALKWARIAINNKRDGLPWHEAAKNAHKALAYALLISI